MMPSSLRWWDGMDIFSSREDEESKGEDEEVKEEEEERMW